MLMKILFTCLSMTVLFVLSAASLRAQNNAMNIPTASWVDCGNNSALNANNIKPSNAGSNSGTSPMTRRS